MKRLYSSFWRTRGFGIFLAPDDAGGGGGNTPSADAATQKVDLEAPAPGEVAADFSELEAKIAAKDTNAKPPESEPDVITPAKPELEQAQTKEERARGEDGKFVKKEEPQKKEEPAVKEDKPKVEPTKEQEKQAHKLPESDKDIEEATRVKANAPNEVVKSVKEIRTLWQRDREHARVLEKQIETLNVQLKEAGTKLPADIEAKIKSHDELVKFREMFEAENDPKFQAEYQTKIDAAEDDFFTFVKTHPQLKLKEDVAKAMKEQGLDNEAGREWLNELLVRVQKTGNMLLYEQVKSKILGRDAIITEKQNRVKELHTNRDGYLQNRSAQEKQSMMDWGKKADEALTKLAGGEDGKGYDWLNLQEEPTNATAEQKAAVAAHNKRVQEEIVPKFHNLINKVFQKDHQASMEAIFKAVHFDELSSSIKSKITEIEQLKERITQLESDAKGVQRISDPTKVQNTAPKPKTSETVYSGASEVSSDQAIDDFRRQKGIA